MNEQRENSFLETERFGALMRRYAVPCIISLLVAALYNIVDQIFIANASYLGSYGNAANTVVFPLTVVALALAGMIGDGCCAFVSICLGGGKNEDAHRSINNSIVLCVLFSLILTVLYFVFQEQILTRFGGRVNEKTFAQSKEYFMWITVGISFYMFGRTMNPIIRSDGSPKFAMISTLAGAVVNIILDPAFIFGFHWGMMGAAMATVLGQALTAVLAVWYLCHMKAIHLELHSFQISGHLLGKILPLGICSFLSQISLVAAMAAINNMIRQYGALDPIFGQPEYAQIPMAVVGIVIKFFQIVISIVAGMAGWIPIVGYNMGAGRKDREKRSLSCCWQRRRPWDRENLAGTSDWKGEHGMKKNIITISREFGSGGHSIAQAVAKKHGVPCYDKALVEQVSKESGFDPEYIEDQGEYTSSFPFFRHNALLR